MKRIEFQVTEDQYKSLRIEAIEKGVSVADLIRERVLSHKLVTTETRKPVIPQQNKQTQEKEWEQIHKCEVVGCREVAVGLFNLYYHENDAEEKKFLCSLHKNQAIKIKRLQNE